MKYSRIKDAKFNAFGNINIISAFPGLGKTTATEVLKADTCFKAYDLDVDEFKKHPGVNNDNWVDLYIHYIKTVISDIGMKMTLAGPDSKTTYIIFVSPHEEVRKALSNEGIPFIYVLPSKEKGAQYLYENVIVPRKSSKDLGEQRSVEFAKKMVEQYKNGEVSDPVEYPGQTIIELDYEIGDEKDRIRLAYLTDVIYDIVDIPLGYRNSHVLSEAKIATLQSKLCKELKKRVNHIRYSYYGKDSGTVPENITVAINSQGYLYVVWDGKRTMKPLRRFAKKNKMSDAVADRLANAGSDFVVLNREDAENIVDMLNFAISKLESGTRQDNDIEVFGDKAISYERLIDEVDHTVLPVSDEDDDEEDY